MPALLPDTPAELARVLADFSQRKERLAIAGNNTKRNLGGPTANATALSTTRLSRVLQYEPADLTISVEAGMRWADLQKTLATHNQMVALDPPFASEATVGGVIASNGNGPLRRGYGTARDLVIGMTFALADGRLIQSGGMVVKNVAGLDMGKLLIGSFGTLAVMTSVNFRVHLKPAQTRTYLYRFTSLDDCFEQRDAILRGVLQPEMLDVFSPVAAARLGLDGHVLAIRAGGSERVLDRYTRELPDAIVLEGDKQSELWRKVREFTPDFLRRTPSGLVLRVSTTLQDMRAVFKASGNAVIGRGGSGVTYVYLNSAQALSAFWRTAQERDWSTAIEAAPEEIRAQKQLCLGGNTEAWNLMRKMKQMFDPENVLNPGRLYGRI